MNGSGTDTFGPVSVAVSTLLLVYAVSAVWLARHSGAARALWNRTRDATALRWMRDVAYRRVRTWMSSLSRRLPFGEVAGVALVLGFVVVAALAIGFTEVREDVLEGDGVAAIDQPASTWLATHRDPWLTTTLRLITYAGSVVALGVLTAVTCAVVARSRRSWLPLLLGLVGAGGIGLVIATAKALVGRDRPPSWVAVIVEHGYSFPSGHATGSAAVALLCSWLLTRSLITSWVGRVSVWATAIGFVGTIGFSRVYLGVHYVSDVLAGWLLGAAWACAVILVGSWWADARQARKDLSAETA